MDRTIPPEHSLEGLRPVSVLIVDDDQEWADQMVDALAQLGHFAIAVHRVKDGIAILRNLSMHAIVCAEKLSDGCSHDLLETALQPKRRPRTLVATCAEPTGCPTDGFDAAWPKSRDVHSLRIALGKLLARPM